VKLNGKKKESFVATITELFGVIITELFTEDTKTAIQELE